MPDRIVVSHVGEYRQALEQTIDRAAEIIRGMMESNAKQEITEAVYDTPETWYRRTGLLRNSITAQTAKDGDDTCVVVGTNVNYAPYVELGTGIYATGGSRAHRLPWWYMGSDGQMHRTFGTAARPYLRPAVEDYARQYKNVLESELRKG